MYVRYLLFWLISFHFVHSSAYADCPTPQGLSVYNVTHQSANFSWVSSSTSSPAYQVQWRVAGVGNWSTNPVTTTALSLTGLTNNTTYEWRVRTICAAGDTSTYATGAAFQTKCNQPTSVNVSNVTFESAQLNWSQPVSGATYEVQWRAAGTTTWTVVSNLTNGFLRLTGLADQTLFEWQVRTICSAAATSDFIAGPFFQTRCLPPTNVRTALINSDAAELKWENPVAGVLYDLQWRPASSSDWTLVEGITTNEYSFTGLSSDTDYVWQVRTACSATAKSAFSDTQIFRTTCAAPSNLYTNTVTNNVATLNWSALASDLQWRPAGAADWTTIPNVRGTYTLTGLTNNTTYEWRVRTVCSPSVASAYTPSQLFTTQCPTPTNLFAYSNQTNGLIVYWTALDNGPFELQWRAVGSANWSVATEILGNGYTLTGLLPVTTYEVRVRRVCSSTDYSAFATNQAGPSACTAPSSAYSGRGTNTTIELVWGGDEAGSPYEVQWRLVNAPDWTTATNITTNRYGLTNLRSNVAYEWRVRKICSATTASVYTTGQSFTLVCQQPSSFSSSNIDESSAKINWSGPYLTTVYPPYEVQYRPIGAASWASISFLTANEYVLTGLTNNTTYEWRIRSSCPSGGPTDFSAIQTFRTQCENPLSLAVSNLNFSSVQLNWQNYGNAKPYEIQYRESGSANWISIRPENPETDPTFGSGNAGYTKYYPLYNLTPGKTYEWRVRRQCSPAIYSDFVTGPTFTTTCQIPQTISAYQPTNTSLRVAWSLATPTTYELHWRSVGTSAWNVISGITSTNYTLTDLTPGGRYEYRVRQVCSPGLFSDYSALLTAQLQCILPDLPTAQPVSASSLRVQWRYINENVDAAAIRHELQYRPEGSSNWISVTDIVGTTYTLTGLTAGTPYQVRVRSVCSTGLSAVFTSPVTFSMSCLPPYPNTYSTLIQATSARVSWSNNAPFNRAFVLQWRVSGASSWSTESIPTSDEAYGYASNYIYERTYLLTGLTNNTAYEWRLAAICGDDYLSDYTPIQTFRTACPSIQSILTSKVGSTSAQLNWYGTSLASGGGFTVQYRIRGQVVWTERSGLTNTGVLLTDLAGSTTYEWRVRTDCGMSNQSGFSSTSTFTTQCPTPTVSSILDLTTQSATLVWVNSPDHAYVNLQWRKAGTGWNIVNGLAGSTYSLTGLTPNTNYEYGIQGVCSVDNQVTNAAWTRTVFTTVSTTGTYPLALVSENISAQAARFNWLSGPDRANYVLQWRVLNGTWNTSGLLATKRYLITGLLPSVTYEVRLSYTDDNGVTYQSSTTFTTSCPMPYVLNVSNITPTKARLAWTTVGIPSTLQWRIAGTATWNVVPDLTAGSYTLTGLTDNTTYEWRVFIRCSATVLNTMYLSTFRTVCSMPTATLTQNVSTESARLSWSGTGASYVVRYRVVGATDWTLVSDLTSTTFVLTGLTSNTAYEWAVSTVCESNTGSTFTSALPFRMQCSLPQNLNISSSNAEWVVVTWDKSGPTSLLQWRVVGQSTWNEQAAATSPYTLTTVTPGLTYEWRVRSTCLAEPGGLFVRGANFVVPQCSTSFGERVDAVTANSAQLAWYTNSLSGYGLRWRAIGSSTWTVVPGNVTSPYTLPGLMNNTLYEWQIRTSCLPNYGSSQVFRTRCNPSLLLQTDALTTNSVILRWNDTGDGVGYKLRWRAAGTSVWNTVADITATSYALTGLTNFTNYEWQVGSQCANDESDFQLTTSFKTNYSDTCPQGMYTLRPGFWDDPTVWSCNRLPANGDLVQLKHAITIQSNYVGNVLKINYEAGGHLTISAGAIIQMGN